MTRRKLWLCVPPTLLGSVDHAVTLWFQPEAYWAGDYSQAREANALLEGLMHHHPLVFEAGVAVWLVGLWTLLLVLPRLPSVMLCTCVTIGHTWGASSWLGDVREACDLSDGHLYWLTVALCILSGIVLTVAVEASRDKEGNHGSHESNE